MDVEGPACVFFAPGDIVAFGISRGPLQFGTYSGAAEEIVGGWARDESWAASGLPVPSSSHGWDELVTKGRTPFRETVGIIPDPDYPDP